MVLVPSWRVGIDPAPFDFRRKYLELPKKQRYRHAVIRCGYCQVPKIHVLPPPPTIVPFWYLQFVGCWLTTGVGRYYDSEVGRG
jgi:hypothetical protein